MLKKTLTLWIFELCVDFLKIYAIVSKLYTYNGLLYFERDIKEVEEEIVGKTYCMYWWIYNSINFFFSRQIVSILIRSLTPMKIWIQSQSWMRSRAESKVFTLNKILLVLRYSTKIWIFRLLAKGPVYLCH